MKYILTMLFLISIQPIAKAGSATEGKQKSATCTACHGATGISPNELWPNLAGQKQQYLLNQLKAFHDGTRNDPLMGPVAKMLSDQDMQDLAAYFSQIKPP